MLGLAGYLLINTCTNGHEPVLTAYAIGMFLMSENNSIVYTTIRKNKQCKEIHQFTGSQSNSSTDRICCNSRYENVDNYFVQYASLLSGDVNVPEKILCRLTKHFFRLRIIQRQRNKLLPQCSIVDTRDGSNLTDDDFIII